MTAAVAIIDANVVVSGVVSSKQDSSVVLILEGMRSGSFRFLLSTPLFDEYREVLLRPKLRKLHCLDEEQVDEVLKELGAHATWLEPDPAVSAPDPKDQHLWDLLASSPAAVLVTGDKPLIENPLEGRQVLLPWDFWKMLFPASPRESLQERPN
jgi:putative PIN family toxin of toxin-antitoxin system